LTVLFDFAPPSMRPGGGTSSVAMVSESLPEAWVKRVAL